MLNSIRYVVFFCIHLKFIGFTELLMGKGGAVLAIFRAMKLVFFIFKLLRLD